MYLNKLVNLLRLDDNYDAVEIKELYEDAIDISENYIHKAIAYTLNEYIFANLNVLCLFRTN